MTDTVAFELSAEMIERIAADYIAVWSEPDPQRRREGVAALWAPDGEELVESARFHGHEELVDRVARAYEAFVESGRFTITAADDLAGHHDVIAFTVQLSTDDGEVAWAARVMLFVGPDGLIRRDYHVTVIPLVQ